MMRLYTLAAFASTASALHLAGPMDDRLTACAAANCPDTSWSTDPDDFDGMGISFPTFVSPPTGNSQRWINELGYVLDVIGYSTSGTCVSTAADDAVGDTDFDACAAITALADDTACVAIMTAATDDAADAAACTYTPTYDAYTYYDGTMTTATCESTDAGDAAGDADFDACAAVADLDDGTACVAVMKDAITASAGSAATCAEIETASPVEADTEACACVTDLADNAACLAVQLNAGGGSACAYVDAVPEVLDEPACTYTPAAKVLKTKTAVDTTTMIAHMTCMCNNCAGAVEAIFQPVGRSVCEVLGADMSCKTELAACEAAVAPLAASGSTATFDTLFTPVGGPGSASVMAPSTVSQCSPAAAFGAYKVDWKLDEFAAEATDGTCTKAGVCAAIDAADADACAAATTSADCLAIETTLAPATCVSTAAADVVGDTDFDACAAVTGADLDSATACEAVKTTATETCAADGAAAGAAVNPSACTYAAEVTATDKCTWTAPVVLAAEVVTYQKCIAASRAAAYEADFNCLEDVGAATCGGEYECTYVAPVADATADKASGAGAAAASAGVLAAVALLF